MGENEIDPSVVASAFAAGADEAADAAAEAVLEEKSPKDVALAARRAAKVSGGVTFRSSTTRMPGGQRLPVVIQSGSLTNPTRSLYYGPHNENVGSRDPGSPIVFDDEFKSTWSESHPAESQFE